MVNHLLTSMKFGTGCSKIKIYGAYRVPMIAVIEHVPMETAREFIRPDAPGSCTDIRSRGCRRWALVIE
jgi:hypothetical protein